MALLGTPTLVAPFDNDTNKTLTDSVTLIWLSSGDGVTYNVAYEMKESPTAYAVKNLDATTFRVAVDSGKTYWWRIEAFRVVDGDTASSETRKYTGRNFDIKSGIIAEWTFEGNAYDMSGNGHNGTTFEAVYKKGRYGIPSQSAYFDGDDDYIEIPHADALNLTPNFTISLWVYPKETSEGKFLIYKCGNSALGKYYISGNGFNLVSNNNLTSSVLIPTLPINSWSFVTYSYDGRKLKSYLDGEYQNYVDLKDADLPCSTSASLLIGSNSTTASGGTFFNGRLDDIRYFDCALADFEITAIYDTWASANSAPEFADITKDSAILGETYICTLSAVDPDGDDLNFSIKGGSSQQYGQFYHKFVDSIITIQFGYNNIGSHNISFLVNDGRGGSDEIDITVTVISKLVYNDSGMVLIPAKDRSFEMGIDGFVIPVHTVSFTYDFWMDTTEVTQGDYDALMSDATYGYSDYSTPNWGSGYGVGDNYPAYNVNWYDAVLYCNARSKRDGKDTVYIYTGITGVPGNDCSLVGVSINLTQNGYHLPTEAEWEYACRAGTTTGYYWGNEALITGNYAWYSTNSGNRTNKVGTRIPNAFGLYDMSGNVQEWCNDWYGSYSSDAVTNPLGALTGSLRVLRGGWLVLQCVRPPFCESQPQQSRG